MGRFQPSRAGIINLWDYRDEEFVFVDGWLVLRGPNGSGKTKALEVLFPFVLDARIEPRRLNPFASEERTMKSNVLYRGTETQHSYVWMEFRSDEEFVTIGIGLRANRYQDRVTRWHFVAPGRVGVDFSLIDNDDRPLNKRDLAAEVGAEHVFDGIEDYRRAVDARLFGLGPARYDQLVDLVLTLRKPMLAKDLDPVELSRTLQRGLRPLDDGLITEAAGSFDDMESVANTLAGLVAADEATAAFLSVYATYLRTHARAAADGLTARRATVATNRVAVTAAEQAQATAQSTLDDATAALAIAESEPGRLRAQLDSLKSSAAYQSQEQLEGLRQHVADLAAQAGRAQAAAASQRSIVEREEAERARREEGLATAEAALGRQTRQVSTEAEAAGIGWSPADALAPDAPVRVAGRAVARRDDVRVVRDHLQRVTLVQAEHDRRSGELAQARAAVAVADEAQHAAQAAATAARDDLGATVARWARVHATVLDEVAPDAAAVVATAVETVGTAGAATLREVTADHAGPGLARVTEELAALRAQAADLDRRRAAVVAERAEIAAARDDAPAPTPGRVAQRAGRSGAPLWRLVDFAPGVAPEQAAAVEAALEAAGILDAWVAPAGAPVEDDGYLVALPKPRRPGGPTLADLLVAEKGAPRTLTEVLASIAVRDEVEAGVSAVTTAGRFANGVVIGAYTKPTAEFIGAAARQRRREQRLAECDQRLAELDASLATLAQRVTALRALLDGWAQALAALPSIDGVLAALRALDTAATTLRLRREAEQAAAIALDQVLAERAAVLAALRRVGAERSLPPDTVDAVAEAVERFAVAGRELEQARRDLDRAAGDLATALARCAEADERLGEALAAAAEISQSHLERRAAYETLAALVDDADSRRVIAEVAATQAAISAAEARLGQVRRSQLEAHGHLQRALATVEAAGAALAVARAEAVTEAVRLRPFAHADLLSVIRCPTDLRWPAEVADDQQPEIVALHEAILAATRDLTPTESSLKQSVTRVTAAVNELQAQLPAAGLDHRCEFTNEDNLITVTIVDEQGRSPVAVFGERIARERREQEQLLSDAERHVFEDALLTQLLRQIHLRWIEAKDLVKAMDAQMQARRMSSGLTVGVGLRDAPELDPAQKDVTKLLERDPARLNPAQLQGLRTHFSGRIKAARAATPELPYRDLLAQVLDYRRWHIFAFTLHRPGAPAEELTKGRHSQLSGGEQSVSLHLPLFAAANALFTSAAPTAPRLVALDEAFAGVDENGRGELMALAQQFGLDLFMTGFDLWATTAAVKGCAHYDLSHSAAEHTVASVLIAWNGAVATADFDGTLARALGSPETRRRPGTTAAATLTPDAMLELD